MLRFFDIDPLSGKFQINGAHPVQVPDGGSNIALGASVVVIYRDPTAPLRAIVMYDGGYTMGQANESMTQRIKGFYNGGDSAKMTHIVGAVRPRAGSGSVQRHGDRLESSSQRWARTGTTRHSI